MSQELQNYINEMREAGYRDSEIKKSLLQSGWPDDYLDALLDPTHTDGGVIFIKNFYKYYGDLKAVDGISIKVEKGEIFGFLGPNGAGKTTTMRTIMDLLRPTSGSIKVFGKDSKVNSVELKRYIGYLPGEVNLYGKWTGQQHINFVKKFADTRAVDITSELVARLVFDPTRKVKELSSGNKQKLGIILALMFRPQILVLDEPTNALDPLLQNVIYKILQEFADNGTTVFMSSHNLTEVERICTKVAIIKGGRIVEISDIKSLKQKRFYDIKVSFASQVTEEDLQIEGIETVNSSNDGFFIKFKGDINKLFEELSRYSIEDIKVNRASLEDIFLEFYQY